MRQARSARRATTSSRRKSVLKRSCHSATSAFCTPPGLLCPLLPLPLPPPLAVLQSQSCTAAAAGSFLPLLAAFRASRRWQAATQWARLGLSLCCSECTLRIPMLTMVILCRPKLHAAANRSEQLANCSRVQRACDWSSMPNGRANWRSLQLDRRLLAKIVAAASVLRWAALRSGHSRPG